MNSLEAKSMNAENPDALQKTLGLGQVLVQTFQEFQDETRAMDGMHIVLAIRFAKRDKVIYDPTTGKRENRPLFFLESQILTPQELEQEWSNGEFFYLSEPQDNIKIIRGLQS